MLSFITLFMLSVSINAQTDAEELTFLQTVFGMEKQELVSSFINPSSENADAFWEVYNEYEADRKEIGKKRLVLLQKYMDSYGNTTDEDIKEMIKEMASIRKSTNKLIEKYYKKLRKVNEVDAAAFFQIEGYIAAKIRVEILQNIPFFGEFK